MSETACTGTKRDGAPCSAKRVSGSDFCSFHDPGKARLFQLGRQVGAKEGGKEAKERKKLKSAETLNGAEETPAPPPPVETKPLDLNGPADIVTVARDALNGVRSGALTPKQGTAIGSLLSVALQGMKHTEELKEERGERPLEKAPMERLQEIERALVAAAKH